MTIEVFLFSLYISQMLFADFGGGEMTNEV